MLFFFGIRSTTVATVPLPDLACAYCHTPDSLRCVVVSRYLHVFWIPILPVGKSSATVCTHCKQVLSTGQMPPSYRRPVLAMEQQARVPLWCWSGLLLVGAVAGLSFLIHLFSPAPPRPAAAGPTEATGEPPAVGTRYRFKLSDNDRCYGLTEVTAVTADTVYYRMTQELRGPLSAASATQALRDSVTSTNAHQHTPVVMWHYATTGQGLMKKLE